MNDFLIMLLATTLNSSFLFIIILIVDKLLYNKIMMRVIYFYIKITLLYCLLPAIVVIVMLLKFIPAGLEEKNINAPEIESIYIFQEELKNIGSEMTFPTNLLFANIIFTVWVIGFLTIFIITYLFKAYKLHILLQNCDLIFDKDIINIKEKIEIEYKLHNFFVKNLRLYKCSYVSSPFLFGIIQPKIIIPDIGFSHDEIEIILRHELMHLKSNDLILKVFVSLVQGIHWYNPIVIFFTKKFDDYCELSCDEKVSDHLSKSQKLVYAQLLLKLTKLSINGINIISFTYSDERFMKRRILSIMKKDQISKTVVSFILLFIITISCPLIAVASSMSATYIDNSIIQTLRDKNSESEKYNPHIFVEHITESESKLTDTTLAINPYVRGANSVDFVIDSHSEAITNSFNVSAGKGIKIFVSSDKASNTFNVGIVHTSGKRRYVESYNGSVDHTFYISESGSYAVYFENTDKSNVHILGTIYVNY